jgi:hypothetical protein
MTPLRQALGAAYPLPAMDPDTVRSISAGLARIERKQEAERIAAPMRELFDMLAQGEVHEIDGMSVMNMPAMGDEREAWCAVGPAIRGWIDCWKRIAPDIGTRKLQYLADRLDADKPITPRLVEQARDEFEQTIRRIPSLPEGAITDAILRTRIAWEFEKLQRGAAA